MRKEISVGVLFLVAVIALAYMVSRLTESRSGLAKNVSYYTLVDDSTGLLEGSTIRTAGIVVGRLTRKSLQEGKARLDLEVTTKLPLHEDATIVLQSLGYLGDRYINLKPGTAGRPVLKEGAFIPASHSATFEDLMDQASGFLESWKGVGDSLRAIFGGRH